MFLNGSPVKPAERYALHNLCGLSEVGLPWTTALISDYWGTDTIVNHKQVRQIPDLVSAIMGNGCLPKTTILKRRENKVLGFLSSLSPSMASCPCQRNSNTPKRMWAPAHWTDTRVDASCARSPHARTQTRFNSGTYSSMCFIRQTKRLSVVQS